jgi:hypothetical protein
MNKPTILELENLIKQHPDIAALGSPADAVSDDWLIKAEKKSAINCLHPTYGSFSIMQEEKSGRMKYIASMELTSRTSMVEI